MIVVDYHGCCLLLVSPGAGDTLIFSYYVGSDHFCVCMILNFNILGFSEKRIFLG